MDKSSICLKNKIIDEIHKGVSKKSIKVKYNLSEAEYLKLYKETLHISNIIKQIKSLSKTNMDDALRLCEKSEYLSYFLIQVQRVKILIKLKRYDDAITICDNPLYSESSIIQYQKIHALMELADEESLTKALSLCEKFPKDYQIQTLKISILILLDKTQLALDFALKNEFRHYIPIQVQIVDILVSQNQVQEALTFLNDERFKDCMQMQKRRRKLEKAPKDNIRSTANNIREQICDIEGINSLEIPESKRMILTVAFYEKNNYPVNAILNYLRHQKESADSDQSMLKIIRCLILHVKEQNKIINYGFYERILRKA